MSSKHVLVFGLILIITGCRSAAPGAGTGPVSGVTPVPVQTEAPPVTQRTWKLQPTTGSRRYRAISITSLDLTGTKDSLSSTIGLTLNSQPEDTTIIFSGTIDSLSLSTGEHISAASFTGLPVAFAGRLDRNTMTLTTPAGCDAEHVPLELIIPQLLFQLPHQEISPGYTWTDTVRISACSGSIPLTSSIIHTFKVISHDTVDGVPALLISRADRTISTGTGSQGQHRVEVESVATGSAQLWIDSTSGQLLKSESSSSGTVAITASGRRQIFNQAIRTTISAH